MRSLLPTITRAVGRLTDMLPMSIGVRLKRGRYRYDPADIPTPPAVPSTPIRVFIAPANFAAQAWNFARALDRLDGVAARNLQIMPGRDYGFPADERLSAELSIVCAPWQRRQFAAVRRFTHVIVESGRSQFGRLFGGDPLREIAALRAAGVSVAHLAHGSELRSPDRHRQIDEWSPFRDESWELVPLLAAGSTAYRRLLEQSAAPVFVTTPDLLLDWPDAVWSPLVVDVQRWSTDAPALHRARPVVAHAPTNRVIKGTDLIEPILLTLEREGLIEYRRVEGIATDEMPAHFAAADVVIDQVRMGIYSAVAVEAMAAGRLTIAHLHEHTVDAVRYQAGRDLPILAVTPATLEQQLRNVVAQPEPFRALAEAGPAFVQHVHNGRLTAEVIERAFLRTAL